MQELSTDKMKELLKKVIWDYKIEPDTLLDILSGKQKSYGHIDRKYLSNRCFHYLNWYKFISLFDNNELLKVLQEIDDDVIVNKRIRKQSYPGLEFAKRFIRNKDLSASR